MKKEVIFAKYPDEGMKAVRERSEIAVGANSPDLLKATGTKVIPGNQYFGARRG